MVMPLYLTAREKGSFAEIDASLTGGWVVEEEQLSFQDTDSRRKLRFDLLRLTDPAFRQMKERILASKTEEEFHAVLKTLDFTKIGNRDFSRLLYALGPDALGLMVADVMSNASAPADIELLAALAGLRHLMLESLIEADF